MANITFNVEELMCEDPVFTHVTYTGTRFEFDLGWTSIGEYLVTIDDTVIMTLIVELYYPNDLNNPYFIFSPPNPPGTPFNANNFLINIWDYEPQFSPKSQIVFKLELGGEDSCYNETKYIIPPDSIQM